MDSQDDVQLLMTLGAIVQLSDAGQDVRPGTVLEKLGFDLGIQENRESVHAHARALASRELISLDERFSGAWLARPTPNGRRTWEAFAARRTDRAARRRQLRNDYLRWVFDQIEDHGKASADDFLNSGANYLGAPYSAADLESSGAWLAERGLIGGATIDQRRDPVLPTISTRGRAAVEDGEDVNSLRQENGSRVHNTFNGPTNVAQQSTNVTQTINVEKAWRNDAKQLAEAIEQVLAVIPTEQRSTFANAASELRTEATGPARPERVRTVLQGIVQAASSGAAGAIGTSLGMAASSLIAALA